MGELRVDGVSVRFGSLPVVRDVSFGVAPGELVAILGASGCGKTTLLRVIAGLVDVAAGTVALGDRELSSPQHRVPPRDRRIGLVFQDYALFPDLDVRSNVGFAPSAVPSEVERLIGLVGLEGLEQRYPRQLSGGQQQRVALARALAARPAVLLLDEPFANLDPHLRATLGGELKALLRAEGCGGVLVTHDRTDALALADRLIVMLPTDRGGVVGAIGAPMDLWREPASEAVAAVVVEGCALDVDGGRTAFGDVPGCTSGRVWVRPDQAELSGGTANAVVRSRRFVGPHWRVEVSASGTSLWVDTDRPVDVEDPVCVELKGGCHVGQAGVVEGR